MQFDEVGRRLSHIAFDVWRRVGRAIRCALRKNLGGIDQPRVWQSCLVIRCDHNVRVGEIAGPHDDGCSVDLEMPGGDASGRHFQRRGRESLADAEPAPSFSVRYNKLFQDLTRLIYPGSTGERDFGVGFRRHSKSSMIGRMRWSIVITRYHSFARRNFIREVNRSQ